MKILICGSRTFAKGSQVAQVLSAYGDDVPPPVVIHGAAKGADSWASFYAGGMGFELEPYPANWNKYGKRAGYLRNQQMLDEGKPDVVYAFVDKPLAESRGTHMMTRLAEAAGLPVYVIYSNFTPSPLPKYIDLPGFRVEDSR